MDVVEVGGASPFFIVRNVPAALAFYRDKFGFEVTFEGPAPDLGGLPGVHVVPAGTNAVRAEVTGNPADPTRATGSTRSRCSTRASRGAPAGPIASPSTS